MIREGVDLRGAARDGVVRERADVVVVGSGCGGATLALALAERGVDVLILEQGGYWTSEDMDQRETHMLAKIDGGRGLDSSRDLSVLLTYGHNVGGASVHYWADSYRTPPDRLALWERRYGLEGHDLGTLTPYFERIEADLHVHEAGETYYNRMNQLLREGARALGWRGAPVPQARKGCVRSGYCMQGCSYDAKQSQLVTTIPAAVDQGARLYADCRADRLTWRGRRVVGVTASVMDRATGRSQGVTVEVACDAVVVAAGGFGTPTFLLRQGLGERLPHLGRHLFCNPCPMVHGVFDEEIVQWRNIPAAWGVEAFRLATHDPGRGTERTHFFGERGAYVEGGYLLMANQLQPALLASALPGVGPEHARLMKALPRIGGTIAWIDDAEEGRITLDGDRRVIDVPLTGGNERRIRDAVRKQARLLFTVGAREVLFGDAADTRLADPAAVDAAVDALDLRPARTVLPAPHPGGGARMGRDASEAVTGFDHRVHGTDNLYVADGSVFPSGPSVDPSVTIMAFSHVAAEHLAAAL